MDKLTDNLKYPLTTFNRCQLCGVANDDICMFRMWYECDEKDEPTDKVLIACQSSACKKVIAEHSRLYREVPWGRGHPGVFMLVCGPCKYRDSAKCMHPKLKENGGAGLEVKMSTRQMLVCFHDGTAASWPPNPVMECEGTQES